MTDRDEARARLKSSIDALADQANMQLKMQKEPLKMLGGATGVGLALGVLVGRNFRRSRKIYVDAASTRKEQKALTKAQGKSGGGSVGGAILATVATLGFKVLQERVIAPRLGEIADRLLDRSAQHSGTAGSKSVTGTKTVTSTKTVDLGKH
jgi:hypothetical protein